MNKKLVVILQVVLLFGGASTILADEESTNTDNHELTELQQPDSHTTLCGEGNGGGGTPG